MAVLLSPSIGMAPGFVVPDRPVRRVARSFVGLLPSEAELEAAAKVAARAPAARRDRLGPTPAQGRGRRSSEQLVELVAKARRLLGGKAKRTRVSVAKEIGISAAYLQRLLGPTHPRRRR